MRRISIVALLSVISAFGKDKPVVTIQVVASQASVREFTSTMPATAAKSTTNCDTNGAVNGDYVNAHTDCTTQTRPGRPAETVVNHIAQEHVRVIMPNGEHVTLWCQEGWRRCVSISRGTMTPN